MFLFSSFLFSFVESPWLGLISLNHSHGLMILEEINLELLFPDIDKLNSYIFWILMGNIWLILEAKIGGISISLWIS